MDDQDREPNYLNLLARRIHEQAVAKGFWEGERRLPEVLTLLHSEVSEVFEAWRDAPGYPVAVLSPPEGWAFEVIDVIIVALDILKGFSKVSIDLLMYEKMAYNESRPYRHGRGI